MSTQDDSGALRERLRADFRATGYVTNGQAEDLADAAIRALSPQGSEPAGVGDSPDYDKWPQWVKVAVRNANEAGRHAGRSDAAPAPAQQAVTDSAGWLIEFASPPDGRHCWWRGADKRSEYVFGQCWTHNASEAIRFCRKEDARAAIVAFGLHEPQHFATEHVWMNPLNTTAQGASDA